MIPSAALICLLETADGTVLETSAMDLSALGLTFRTPLACRAACETTRQVTLRAHRFTGDEACTLARDGFTLVLEEETPDALLWRLETDDPAARALLRTYMADFARYAALKQAGDEAQLSAALTGYPAEGERVTGATFAAQRAAWLADCVPDEAWLAAVNAIPELAVALTDEGAQAAFLLMPPDAFAAWYWQTHGLAQYPLAGRRFDCAYLGSQYCLHLLPEEDMLYRLLERCQETGVRPVVALAPVPEGRLDEVLARLDRLATRYGGCAPVELVVNDWGLPQLLKGRSEFVLTMGLLLNKRRKDVRLPYMQGFGGRGALLAENAANDPVYRAWLSAQGFARLSAEACGYPFAPPAAPMALHLPFYQMNTAGHCTLAARCEQGDRGRQTPRAACPHWCRTHAFLYPDSLRMAGRYNTLFGLDMRSLTDGAYLASLATRADRLVIDLL